MSKPRMACFEEEVILHSSFNVIEPFRVRAEPCASIEIELNNLWWDYGPVQK